MRDGVERFVHQLEIVDSTQAETRSQIVESRCTQPRLQYYQFCTERDHGIEWRGGPATATQREHTQQCEAMSSAPPSAGGESPCWRSPENPRRACSQSASASARGHHDSFDRGIALVTLSGSKGIRFL